jgi:peptide deformylase
MSILKVARMGHPVLRERARKVDRAEITTPEFQKLIDDMFDTMDEYDGIGLAAPQVHESVRLLLVGIHESGEEHGEGQERHGEAQEGHGEAREGHGEARERHGEAREGHGEARERHGEARERHGEAEDGDREAAGEDEGEESALSVYALINPEITPIGREKGEDWEGCLSLPGLRGRVRRPNDVKLVALDREANRIEMHLHGYPARVLQHEADHLDGVLFVDRMDSFETLTFLEEYAKYWAKAAGDDRT